MGQEAGKPTWPKPAGGYQTITGRRYGRRHAYVSFRPSLVKQESESRQEGMEHEGMELDSVQKNPCAALASDVETLSENLGPELCVDVTAAGQQGAETTLTATAVPRKLKDKLASGNSCNPEKISEASAELNTSDSDAEFQSQSGVGFVSIDSFEPDSSDGEDESMEVGRRIQRKLDNMLSELEKGVDYLSGLESYFSTVIHYTNRDEMDEWGPVSSRRHSSVEMELTPQNNNKRTVQRRRSLVDDETVERFNSCVNTCEIKPRKCENDISVKPHVGVCNGPNASDYKVDQGNSSEMVVRPKVRREMQSERRKLSNVDVHGSSSGASRSKDSTEVQPGFAECASKNGDMKVHSDSSLSPRESETAEENKIEERKKRKCVALQEEKDTPVDDSSFWEEFEDYSGNSPYSNKDDDSSECSDGEWSAAWTSGFAMEREYSSSDESWETLPGRDEPEPEIQSSGSSLEEHASELCFPVGEQTALEEGEIPWLSYHEESDSSSDEETDAVGQFVHPGFFLLDSNNNLEDDSSMSEDLDVEWRLLDEFDDGLGAAHAMSYMGPQFLTYMALEERLAQAMEAAMAHLESLAIDVEQAHPPATRESIDCLPQIVVTEDHNAVGQEQCCAICCSEYIKDEIITELPCHHLFHKPCVTLWLQKSGTCPVCRHVLIPALPEAAAATSFLSDHDTPPSIHSAAGTR